MVVVAVVVVAVVVVWGEGVVAAVVRSVLHVMRKANPLTSWTPCCPLFTA